MRLLGRTLLAAAVGVSFTAAGYAIDQPAEAALGPGEVTVVLDIEHSAFTPQQLRVTQGTTVRFVVANHDPINHELIVGPPDVHDRHRNGTEAEHAPVPGEVSVGPGERAVTSYTFGDAGTVEFACHLPGHLRYGMRGEVQVVAN